MKTYDYDSLLISVTMKKLLSLGAGMLLLADFASAGIVTAYEEINDPAPYEFLDRDFSRIRSSDGFFENLTDSSLIISENNIDDDFGVLNMDTVSYEHNLLWLDPAADSYIDAELTISAWGSLGDNDEVWVEDVRFLGTLPAGFGSGTVGFSEFTFYSANGNALDVLFGDGILKVEIDKNVDTSPWGPFWGDYGYYNAISVYGSRLDVTYHAVPEPASLLSMLTAGVIGLLFIRRRRAANNS